ncbi:tetratricopeptide repeat protein [Chitinibacter tainanensis]|uniref:tetratricopeptide repeat protein n=1 Tax=Chitinibacter tainanensis TaxID=230667 RepID=UPI000426067A|nr:tetratricopeptide repeat protein [Chitinibacter tainanensis]
MSALRTLFVALPLLFSLSAHAADSDDIQQLIRSKQFAQALERADKSLAKTPKDAQVRFLRALALSELGRSDEAIKAFTQISEEFPQLPEPYNNLAVLYANKGQFDKARTALQMAIQTNPSYAIAHENMGDLYARLASQAYDKALQLESNNAQIQTKLKLVDSLFSQPGRAVGSKPTTAATLAPTNKPLPVTIATIKPAITAAPAVLITPRPTLAPTVVPTAVVTAKPTPTAKPTATPKATAAPTATPKAEKSDSAAKQQVLASVEGWANAWSRQNVKGYLNSYSKNFKAPGGRSNWEKDREAKISSPKSISVDLRDVRVEMIDEKTAKVRLRQDYKSDRLSTSTGKTLILEKVGSRWLISDERIGG